MPRSNLYQHFFGFEVMNVLPILEITQRVTIIVNIAAFRLKIILYF